MDEQPTAPPELVAYLAVHDVPHNIVVPAVSYAITAKTATQVAKVIGTDPAAIVAAQVWQAANGGVALVIAAVAAKVSVAKLAAATGQEGWHLASPEATHAITGFSPVGGVGGMGVPPVGPGYGDRFPVLIDRAVMAHPVVFGAGGQPGVLLCLLPRAIERLTGATVHDLVARKGART